MAKQTVIHEVGKITAKRLSDNKVIASGVTQMTQFSQQVQQDFLKGGWGNRDLYVINSSKEVSVMSEMLSLILISWQCSKV